MTYAIANSKLGKTYEKITTGSLSNKEHRWIGRCKKCGRTHKVEGHAVIASPGMRGGGSDYAIHANDGQVYYQDTPHQVTVPCGDHWCRLEWVTEGNKKSKHECGARCTNATGPNCDCRCKGKNHGSNC